MAETGDLPAPVSDAAPAAPLEAAPEGSGEWDAEDPGTTAFDKGTPDAGGKPLASAETTPATETAPAAGVTATETPATPAAPAPPTNQQVADQVAGGPQLSPVLMQRAAALGWSPETLANFHDPEKGVLEAERAVMLNLLAQQQRFGPSAATQQPQAPSPQSAQQPTGPQAQQGGFDEAAEKQFWINQGFDEEIAARHASDKKHQHDTDAWMAQHYGAFQQQQQVIGQLQAKLQQTEQAHVAQQHAAAGQFIDSEFKQFVSGLEPAFKAQINTAEQLEQIKLATDTIVKVYQAQGIPMEKMPPLAQLFQQGMHFVYGDKMQAIARDQIRGEVTAHQDRAIARPSAGGRTPAKPGDEAAGVFADNWWRTNGSKLPQPATNDDV